MNDGQKRMITVDLADVRGQLSAITTTFIEFGNSMKVMSNVMTDTWKNIDWEKLFKPEDPLEDIRNLVEKACEE